jgi:dimethylargininase
MRLAAITREVSPSINRCELSFHPRSPIDLPKAMAQHHAYQDCLARLGIEVISLPAQPDLPDSVFVEDAAVILDEIAVMTRTGAVSRRPESATLVETISEYRRVAWLTEPATLDGGDVLRIGRRLFVGATKRSNAAGIEQLRELVQPHGFRVHSVDVGPCLHLKSACSYLGDNAVLVNPDWVDPSQFGELDIVAVDPAEAGAANVLLVSDQVIMPSNFPRTESILQQRGFAIETLDVSELQKAEAGVTCCSLIFAPGR